MKSLQIARALATNFGARTLRRHAGSGDIQTIPLEDADVHLVFKPALVRRILLSKAFRSVDTFAHGLRRADMGESPAAFVREFLADGLVFKEGPEHHADKREMMRLLDVEIAALSAQASRLVTHFRRRAGRIESPLAFAHDLVGLCMAQSMSRITGAPLLAVTRAMRARANIFYYHYHQPRVDRAGTALSMLRQVMPPGLARINQRLAESFLMMGYDPTVATVCASLLEHGEIRVAEAPNDYCAVSFTPRLCVQPTSIAGQAFAVGDICYVALLPGASDVEPSRLAFAAGAHTCAGKRYSRAILEVADAVQRAVFPEGFPHSVKVKPDGAFLAFEEDRAGRD